MDTALGVERLSKHQKTERGKYFSNFPTWSVDSPRQNVRSTTDIFKLLTPSRFEFRGGAHKGRSGECLQEKVSCCDLDS